MEILGIGPLELLFVIILALIILGPNDMIKAGKTIGRVLRTIITSPNWRAVQQTSREIRSLPNRLMREAGLDDIQKEFSQTGRIQKELGIDEIKKDLEGVSDEISEWTTPPTIGTPPKPSDPSSDPPADPTGNNTSN
jgi:Sec-independent protein translocase protein TatA